MKIKVAELIADFLVEMGVTDMFTITGGAAMHLNDAFGHKEGLNCIYNHHEQGCTIAAEGYARYTGKIAAVCVTAGPGGTNAITGVVGGYQDSIPMFVITGQAKRETTIKSTWVPLRQLGDQEVDIVDCVKGFTKYAVMVWEPNDILYHLQKAWYLANSGRKGPVWLDIPLDVQAAMVERDELRTFDAKAEMLDDSVKYDHPEYDKTNTKKILELLKNAKRPVILGGTAINIAGAVEEFRTLVHELNIPTVTAWNAHDILLSDDPVECGRPGTVGNRPGNFLVQNCDVLLVLGSRINIRMSSYNYHDYAKDAVKIMVDIDKRELSRTTIVPDVPVHADLRDVIADMLEVIKDEPSYKADHSKWLKKCKEINEKYPACLPEYYNENKPLNPYVFNEKLFKEHLTEGDAVACGNGAACVITFQSCYIKNNQRVFSNSGCAAMGYGFPAAIGAAVARGDDRRTICIDGDGSFQMNIQEIQTVVHNHMNLKIIILNNNGYHSIRQTQKNLFKGRSHVGISSENGVSFPDLSKLAPAYGLPYFSVDAIDSMDAVVEEFLNTDGPALLEAFVDENQNFEPKTSSKVLPDGRIVSPPLDDMYPFLQDYEEIKNSLRSIED